MCIYICIYICNSIKIHIICTLQVAYGMVLIHLETGSYILGSPTMAG